MYQETECKIINCNNKRRKGSNVCTKHFKLRTKIENVNVFYNLYYYTDQYNMILKLETISCYKKIILNIKVYMNIIKSTHY